MMRWSFWLFVLAEFCRRRETKGTWRRVCTAESPAGSRGRTADGDQGKPHDAVGFLALGWNWFHWLSEMLQDVPLGQAYSQVRHYGYFIIGSVQISWVAPEDSGGIQTPPTPLPSPRGLATAPSWKHVPKASTLQYLKVFVISTF